MNTRKEVIKRTLGLLLLVAFGAYYLGITAFTHVHSYDGRRYVHSHPLSPNPHEHSSTDYQTIANLSLLFFVATTVVLAGVTRLLIAKIIQSRPSAISLCEALTLHGLRAPPFSN